MKWGDEVVDLTYPLKTGMPVFQGDPSYSLTIHADFPTDGCRVSSICMGLHTGTHIDLPLHYLSEGADAGFMPPDTFLGEGVVVDCPKCAGENVTLEDIRGADIEPGQIVLIRTGWDCRAGTPAFHADVWPGVETAAVEFLIAKGAKAIGVDTPSIDPAGKQDSHKIALTAGLPIYECLVNLRLLVGRTFTFIGLPLRIQRAEASPVRAVAILR